jgi:hypothetical protein
MDRVVESEGVSDAEVDPNGIESRRDIEIGVDRLRGVGFVILSVPEGLVRRMDSHSDIEPDDESVDIEP